MVRLRIAVLIALMVSAAGTSPAVATPESSPEDSLVHTVRAGETLWSIARLHGVTVERLIRINARDNPDRLRIGDQVTLPGPRTDQVPAGRRSRLRQPDMAWPSRGVVTSRFGFRGKRHHHGIDIAAPIGSPIRAVRDGVVRFAGWQSRYGRLVILDHGDGLTTWYAHASELNTRAGQRVKEGTIIARVGISGQVTGPNLHFEVRRNSTPLDPWPFLSR